MKPIYPELQEMERSELEMPKREKKERKNERKKERRGMNEQTKYIQLRLGLRLSLRKSRFHIFNRCNFMFTTEDGSAGIYTLYNCEHNKCDKINNENYEEEDC